MTRGKWSGCGVVLCGVVLWCSVVCGVVYGLVYGVVCGWFVVGL